MKIEIHTGYDAVRNCYDLADLLMKIVVVLAGDDSPGERNASGSVIDINGNKVGKWVVDFDDDYED